MCSVVNDVDGIKSKAPSVLPACRPAIKNGDAEELQKYIQDVVEKFDVVTHLAIKTLVSIIFQVDACVFLAA